MKIIGVICEYNPFHLGHKKQFDAIRAEFGDDSAIVCLMSGNFVQRGMPAILHKSHRAKAAIVSGADLVLELPLRYLCKPDCKGLCCRCGKNLNDGPCGCQKEIDPRLAALRQLLDK